MSDKNEIINTLINRIIELVHPLQIILFGSAARSEMTPDSDIDLLVVMPEGAPQRETARYLYRHLTGISIPYDLVVVTHQDLTDYKDDVGFIYYYALKEGKTVYDGRKTKAEVI